MAPGIYVVAFFLFISGTVAQQQVDLNTLNYDNFRVSNNQPQAPRGYTVISAAKKQQQVDPLSSNVNTRAGNDQRQANANAQSKPIPKNGVILDQLIRKNQSRFELTNPQQPACYWWSLAKFLTLSIKSGDVTLKDIRGEPCYRIKIKGFLRHGSDKFFPLSNFKATPNNRVVLERPNDGAGFSGPLNCSLPAHFEGDTSLNVKPKQLQSFSEGITLALDCGYLVLNLHSDGFFLALDSISFYIDPSSPLFTSLSSKFSPLFVMPIDFKYECSDRVILTGNNSVQLFLESFSLERLTPGRRDAMTGEDSMQSQSDNLLQESKERRGEQESGYFGLNLYRPMRSTSSENHYEMREDTNAGIGSRWRAPDKVLRCPVPSTVIHALESLTDTSEPSYSETLARFGRGEDVKPEKGYPVCWFFVVMGILLVAILIYLYLYRRLRLRH